MKLNILTFYLFVCPSWHLGPNIHLSTVTFDTIFSPCAIINVKLSELIKTSLKIIFPSVLRCFIGYITLKENYSLANIKKDFLPSVYKTTKWNICYYCLDKCMILLYCASDINRKLCRTYCESRILNGPKFVIITEH